MSFISSQIKDSGMYDYLVEQVIDELEALEKKEGELRDRIKQLEQELESAKKDQARYQYVRNMPPEDFLGIKGDCPAFDKAIDAAIKESSK